MSIKRKSIISCLLASIAFVQAEEANYGISGNPGAVNVLTGTGQLGRWLHIPEKSGVRLGGLWVGDYNYLMHGGHGAHHNRRWTGNSLFILDLSIDLQKAIGWKHGYFGAEFLQFNGQPTNGDAGVVQGYNSLPGSPPLNRSELYQLWIRQEFMQNRLSVRIGKVVPTDHFNNVSKPVPTNDPSVAIPSVTGLIYTPIPTNPTLLGAIGGFYNSVYGIIATISPTKEAYINIGSFDGNVARGVQTGLTGPHFNGYYFSIMEVGYGWSKHKPGIAALGGWYQSGTLKSGTQKENGTGGIYGFASQALWIKEGEKMSKGNISGFVQFGWNNSCTLPMNLFFGMGATAFALIPKRPLDSFGVGAAWSRLNHHTYERYSELMLQGYYQANVYKSIYFQPVLSYIPNPGAQPDISNVWALTGRLIVLF
jgi:porin